MKYSIFLFCIIQYLFIKHVEGKTSVFHLQVLPEGYKWNVSVKCSGCIEKVPPQETSDDNINEYLFFHLNHKKQIKGLTVEINPSKNKDIKREWKLIPSKGQTREGNFFNFAKTHTIHFGQFEKTENGLYLSIKIDNAVQLDRNEKYFAIVTVGSGLKTKTLYNKMLDDKTIIVETKEVQTINDEEFKLDFSEKDSKLKKFLSKTVSTVCIYKKYKCNHKLKDTCKGEKYVESYYYKNDSGNRYCTKCKEAITTDQNYPDWKKNTPDPKPEFTYTFDFSKEEDQSKEINISVKLVDIPNELKKQMDRNSSFSSLPLASGGNTPRGPLTKGISRLLSFASSSSGKSSSKKVFENDAIPFVVDSENEDLQFPNNRSDIEGEQFDHSNVENNYFDVEQFVHGNDVETSSHHGRPPRNGKGNKNHGQIRQQFHSTKGDYGASTSTYGSTEESDSHSQDESEHSDVEKVDHSSESDQETSDTSSQAQVWDHSGWIPENRGSFSGNGDYHPHPQGNTNMYDPTHLNNVNDKDETSTSTQQRRSRKSCGRKNEQLQNTKVDGEATTSTNTEGHKSNYGGKYHHNTNLDGFDASDVIPNNVLYPQYYSDGYTIYGYCDNYGNLYDKYRNFYGYYDNYGNFIQMKM